MNRKLTMKTYTNLFISVLIIALLSSCSSSKRRSNVSQGTGLDINSSRGGFQYETNYKGQEAVYLKNGSISPKNLKFLNGTIEYDIYLKE